MITSPSWLKHGVLVFHQPTRTVFTPERLYQKDGIQYLEDNETRSWSTQYRGKILIHAAQRRVERADCAAILMAATAHNGERAGGLKAVDLLGRDYGCIVAIADLTDCEVMLPSVIQTKSLLEQAVGNWAFYRFAWKLENVIPLPQPIPHKGGQGLRNAPDELKQPIQEALHHA
jgi:hypothetical protein